jgi:protoporphyrinogen/coproporphyrinogen III oxidase
MPETIVIGAGISGLTAAHRLAKDGRDVLLLEASGRVGGAIATERVDGFVVERGPNTVRMTDEIEALATDLGIAEEIVYGDPRAPRYLFHEGRLVPAPSGVGSFLRTPLLSKRAKLRLLAEPFVRRPSTDREPTIAEFVTRRLGREIHDVFVSAFVSGVYAGDTSKLSALAVFPKLVEFEREHGGLVRGALASRRKPADAAPPKARRRLTIASFPGGLDRLPRAAADALGDRVKTSTRVERVERVADGYIVVAEADRSECRELVVATPADEAARLLGPHSARLARELDAIEYPPLVSVALAYERERVEHPANGFGFLAPRMSGLRTLGAIFGSSLFEGRAPDGWLSFTCFVGGATDPTAVELSDDAIVDVVAGDLARALGASGAPRVLSVTRWRRAIPQFTVGHVARVAAIEDEAARLGVRLLGNYLHGVSVGDCVAEASKLP